MLPLRGSHNCYERLNLRLPYRNLIPVTSHAQAALETVQREIAACALCVEAGFIPRSLPIFHGHAGQQLMIVGQAPGPSAGERPLPYTGATGRTLQRWLERAGFPPEALHRDFYLTSLTKCFPGPATGSGAKGDRPPSAREIALCARHLGPGDRAGAAADRRRAGTTGRGAPRSDGAGSTLDRSRGEPPSGGARGARLSSAASATSFRCLALVE